MQNEIRNQLVGQKDEIANIARRVPLIDKRPRDDVDQEFQDYKLWVE